MTTTLIRVAGPYTVTTDGIDVFVNGAARRVTKAGPRDPVPYLIDTQERGANGKPNMIGITAEQHAMIEAARAAHPRNQRTALEIKLMALEDDAFAADRAAIRQTQLTGRAVLAPSRAGEIAAARAALAAFDERHPEVKAQIAAEKAAHDDEMIQSALRS